VIHILQEQYDFLKKEYSVSKIGIFGSVLNGTLTENSDLDIVVEFEKPIGYKFFRLIEYLEHSFGRKVDVVTKDGIKNIRVKEVVKNIESSLLYV
jgi:predicted nucleotidyltransferase